MLKRIATGWTWIRAAYFLIGTFVIVQSAFEGEWIGILLGAWPAAMGFLDLPVREEIVLPELAK